MNFLNIKTLHLNNKSNDVADRSPQDRSLYSVSSVSPIFSDSPLAHKPQIAHDPISSTVLRVHHLPISSINSVTQQALKHIDNCVSLSVISQEFGSWLTEMIMNTEELKRNNSRKRIRFVEKSPSLCNQNLSPSEHQEGSDDSRLRTKEFAASFEVNKTFAKCVASNKDESASVTSCFKSVSRMSSLSSCKSGTALNAFTKLSPLAENGEVDIQEFDLDPTSQEWAHLVSALRTAGLFLEAINYGTNALPWQTAISKQGRSGYIYRRDSQQISKRQTKYISKNRKSLYIPSADSNGNLAISKEYLLKPVPSIGTFKRPPPRNTSLPSPPDSLASKKIDFILEATKQMHAQSDDNSNSTAARTDDDDDNAPLVPKIVKTQHLTTFSSTTSSSSTKTLQQSDADFFYAERLSVFGKPNDTMIYPSPFSPPKQVQNKYNQFPATDIQELDEKLVKLRVEDPEESDITYSKSDFSTVNSETKGTTKAVKKKWVRQLFSKIGNKRSSANTSVAVS